MKRFLLLALWLMFPAVLISQNSITLSNISYGEIQVAGFQLDEKHSISIEAIGLGFDREEYRYHSRFDDPENMYAYAWILNADTRQLVWRMTPENTKKLRWRSSLRKFDGEIELPPGRYELYFTAFKPRKRYLFFNDVPSLGKWLQRLLRGEEVGEAEESEFFITSQGMDRIYTRQEVFEFQKHLKNRAIVSLTDVENSGYYEEHFTLSEPGLFEVYGVGESLEDGEYDYGWIVNTQTGQKIWEMSDEESEYGGGAGKNRVWRTTLTLEPGTYSAFYLTDDSHSPEQWNANPPYDPNFWGITIWGVPGKFSPESVKESVIPEEMDVIQLTRLHNDEFVFKDFRVTRPIKLHLIALGEGDDGEMYDYGWIRNLETGEVFWEMEYAQTQNAGGAKKNRLADLRLDFPPGLYRVYFVTDDSHSFEDWNASPPPRPERWGITLSVMNETDKDGIQEVKEPLFRPLVSILKVGDNEHIKRTFHLSKVTPLRIFAVGEGSDGEMYDFGWIEDEKDGSIVWKMEYDQTQPAGGASKNRLEEDFLTLPSGDYVVHYQSDGSHSYDSWNAAPPALSEQWGITVSEMSDTPIKVTTHPQKLIEPTTPILKLTRLGNRVLDFRVLVVHDGQEVLVKAVGEGRSNRMRDYGWIVDITSGETVWTMKYHNTRHAGGAQKNRIASEKLFLLPGIYLVYFKTDGVHSYPNWNSTPPDNPEEWGISIYAQNHQQKNSLLVYQRLTDIPGYVAQILGDRNSLRREVSFSLKEDAEILIYAQGEGFNDEMYDYGWIEDQTTRNVIWLMEYKKTNHGGGSRKNRIMSEKINLPAGNYILHYETDNSHAMNRWNSPPPDDPLNYGVTIIKTKK